MDQESPKPTFNLNNHSPFTPSLPWRIMLHFPSWITLELWGGLMVQLSKKKVRKPCVNELTRRMDAGEAFPAFWHHNWISRAVHFGVHYSIWKAAVKEIGTRSTRNTTDIWDRRAAVSKNLQVIIPLNWLVMLGEFISSCFILGKGVEENQLVIFFWSALAMKVVKILTAQSTAGRRGHASEYKRLCFKWRTASSEINELIQS